jgi:tetratricopeptide (TPR) repeat protein
MTRIWKLSLIAALAAGCLPGTPATRAVMAQAAQNAPRVHSETNSACPSQENLNTALAQASTLMGQARFQDAAETLNPLAGMDCDPRVTLLLAAAFEAGGDVPKATDVLLQAHSVWPSNNSIAVSLAREYLNAGQEDKAAQALAHFHATASTPQQELEEAVLVYFAAHQLVFAQAAAETAYKSYPSLHTLLLLANALQLEGRYPDVNRLLGNKRKTYADSPDFFITLAESESDASIYPTAREDLEHAIALDPKSHQAHYLLGYVLSRLNQTDRAIDEFHTAIDLAPDQPRTYYQLALALRAKQDDTGEEQALSRALAIDDHYAPAQCEMGRILLEEHREADAVSHLTSAIQYNPRSEEGYFLLAKAYAGLGEKDKSDEMVKRLLLVRKENRATPGNKSETPSPSNEPERP